MKILKTLNRFSTGKDTCLKQVHLSHKARMVQFAGYSLPVMYDGKGITKEHLHCRESASIFDVSHMGQLIITGEDRVRLLQRSTVGSTKRGNKDGMTECYLTMFLNEKAGIIDDAIACNNQQDQSVRIVINGANKYIVLEHLQQVIKSEGFKVNIDHLEQHGLVAFQGPKSAEILEQVMSVPKLEDVPFMTQFQGKYQGQNYTITRSGYTGQDGFEISSIGPNVVSITQALLKNNAVALAGLGARDSLRLQAGLCLHGHDILPTITPLEATLMWTVNKRKAGDQRIKFIGEDVLAKQQADVKAKTLKIRKRVGWMLNDSGVVRDNIKLFDKDNKEVGVTTSGIPTPSLKKNIGMAYVDSNLTAQNTQLWAEQRGKRYSLSIKKMPFVPSNYYKRW